MSARNPKEVRIPTLQGSERTYTIHHMSAYDGRKVAVCYTQGALPKIGEYDVNEEMSLLMMRYVSVLPEGANEPLFLQTKAQIENHVPDWECLARLEIEMIKYNTSFFQEGKASGLLETFVEKGTELISSMLTDLSERSSAATKQH